MWEWEVNKRTVLSPVFQWEQDWSFSLLKLWDCYLLWDIDILCYLRSLSFGKMLGTWIKLISKPIWFQLETSTMFCSAIGCSIFSDSELCHSSLLGNMILNSLSWLTLWASFSYASLVLKFVDLLLLFFRFISIQCWAT